ncbi:DivIVA domain-containing protein [Cryobacterium sp. TMT1-62]|uniref:Cell wall synthesis protein Wag31 n=1 Tax=Cryobacterium sandaracinum TaxID=1259247 RepID=A0ABY2JFM6_9MICO|nr:MULTISPECIES: DivIVA domain-containing protein [Cryobacterium]TFB60445.1 DivIVA domain-containing protein [Cryobacterium sp. Sr3]TFC38943.1 DivIVA domain-containing protein [Cryobacterium sp. TMT2-14]TFC54294.1 DivIVA domain-containing protein [Cryobacterium sp. TMT2-17-1]TFC67994.1 DivIVA domain-containing protein [Cryobacterium sp. TMT2-4]TFD04491.1 DivIVA domain-containing protein [Cryobacterium sandaracinum]
MALTPEDVVNKRFQSTKFREGYDQDEVDDFLDEVVVELRRLTAENEELKARVSSGGAAEVAPAPEAVAEPVVAPAVVAAPVVAGPIDETAGTTNLLQLARRLHEEHVKEGAEKRDALIAEGHATAARLVAEAEAKQRAQLSILDQERSVLETKIDDLRTFEREYRQKLKSYIETQLRDLDATSPVESSNASKSSFQSFGA